VTSKATTVDEYLASLPDDRRADASGAFQPVSERSTQRLAALGTRALGHANSQFGPRAACRHRIEGFSALAC
jgi:hypothetical protein